MSLIGNFSVYNKSPHKFIGTGVQPTNRGNFNQSGPDQNRFFHIDKISAQPIGYRPPYTYVLPRSEGGIASTNRILGEASLSFNLAGGRNIQSAMDGAGIISDANMKLILEFAANLIGSGEINSAALAAAVYGICSLEGSSTVDGYIGATVDALCSLSGTGSQSSDINATADISADISPFTELSPEALAAAVWNALTTDYDASGSMGEAISNAGGTDTSKLLTVAKFLALK